MAELPHGAADIQALSDGGYSADEIAAYKQKTTEQLLHGGFKPQEIEAYWGDTKPDNAKLQAFVKGNVSTLNSDDKAKIAENPIEIFRAGLQHGTTSLLSGPPTLKAPPDMGITGRITYQAGQLVNEAPEMAAGLIGGAALGGAAGTAIAPGPGTAAGAVVGGGAGANALPTAMREILTDYYNHPSGKPLAFDDLWKEASQITLDTLKAGAVGGAANVAGAVGGRVVSAAGGGAITQGVGNITAATVAATTAGAAIEGQVPTLNDFVTGAALAIGMWGSGAAMGVVKGAANRFIPSKDTIAVATNLRDIYVKTGMNPKDALDHAQTDPGLQGEVLAPHNAAGETVTPGLKALASPEPPPFKTEPQIEAPLARRPEIAFGDSLAAGTIRHAGMYGSEADFKTGENLPGTARIGATTTEVLRRITDAPPESIQGKDVLLSTGASNSPSRLDVIKDQIQALKDKGARSVQIMGVGTNEKLAGVNDALQKIADESGGTVHFIGPLKHVGPDGIHSTNYRDEIAGVVGQHMQGGSAASSAAGAPSGAATGEGATPGATTAPAGEKATAAPSNGLAQYATGNARPGGASSVEGVHPEFANRIRAMVQDMPPEIAAKFKIISGFRDQHREQQVYAEQHPGQPVPRDTYHSHGMAVDVAKDPELINWIDQNGGKYGVGFTLKSQPGEQNHLEPTENGQRVPHDQLDAWAKEHGGEPTAQMHASGLRPSDGEAARAASMHSKPGTLIAPTPESVTPEHLTLFRTLEGNRDGTADHAVSPSGAIGRNQIMPQTARDYGFDADKLQDPDYNDMVARHIISDLSVKFEGNLADMLVAYNAGPGRARMWIEGGRKIEDLPIETQHYLEHAERLGALDEGYNWKAHDRALTAQGDNGGWVPPNGPPPRLPPPGGEEPLGLPGPKAEPFALNEEMMIDKTLDIVGTREERSLPDWLNPRKWISEFQAQLTPLRNLDKRMGVTPDEIGAEDMARQVYGSAGRAGSFIRWGVVDPITLNQKNDASLVHAFQAVKNDGGTVRGFIAYLLNKHALEKEQQGIETGVDLDNARNFVEHAGVDRKYERGAAIWRQVTDGTVDYGVGSGLFSEAQGRAMKLLNQAYVTSRRIMDPEYQPPRPPGRNFAVRTVKKMTGSDRQIDDPLTATMDNIHTIIGMADRNRMVGAIINEANAKLPPEQALFTQVKVYEPPAKRPSNWDVRDADGKPLHTEWFQRDENGNYYPISPDADEAVNLLDTYKTNGRGIGANEFVYFNQGKMEIWHTKDPDIAEVMKMPWPGKPGPFASIFRAIASLQRSGITSQLSFPFRAIWHGQLASTVLARDAQMVPYHDIMKGFWAAWNQDGDYQRWVRNGGADAALTSIDTNYIQRDIDRIFRLTGTENRVWNYAAHPLEALQAFQHSVDSAARVGYFLRSEQAGVDPMKAAMNSRTAYLDHAEPLARAWLQELSRWVPFMSVGWKDMQQLVKAMGERPVGTTMKGLAVLTAPTVFNYAVNAIADQYLDDKDKYINLPQWERDMYWVLPPINGVRMKIPRPYNVGWMFATMPEHFMQFMRDDSPGWIGKFADSIVRQVLPPMTPTLAVPPMEAAFNYNALTAQPLINQSLEGASGYMNYRPDTTETAKAIGRLIGAGPTRMPLGNPIVTDEFLKQWAGPAPYYILKAIETPIKPPGPPWQVSDLPFVGAFIARQPHGTGQAISDFYDKIKEVEASHADLRLAIQHGNPLELRDQDLMQSGARLTQINEALAGMNRTVSAIDQSTDMTNDEKRKSTDQITNAMIQTARAGLAAIAEIQKAARTSATQ